MNTEPGPLPLTAGDDQSPLKAVDTALSLIHDLAADLAVDRTLDLALVLDLAAGLGLSPANELALERARALDLPRTFARALPEHRVRALAQERARTLAHRRGLILDLARTRAHDLYLRFGLDVGFGLDLARDRTRDLYLNLDQARSLAYDLADDLDFARDLSCGRDVVHAFAHARDRNAGLDLAVKRGRTCLATVIADLERLKTELALAVDEPLSRGATAGSARTWESRVALRLTRLTTRCLPARHRARYREEYAAELSDLHGAPRRAQWRYALNTLAVAWKLRYELRRADRRPAPDRRLG